MLFPHRLNKINIDFLILLWFNQWSLSSAIKLHHILVFNLDWHNHSYSTCLVLLAYLNHPLVARLLLIKDSKNPSKQGKYLDGTAQCCFVWLKFFFLENEILVCSCASLLSIIQHNSIQFYLRMYYSAIYTPMFPVIKLPILWICFQIMSH